MLPFENPADFLDTREFAVIATLIAADGAQRSFPVLFDNAHFNAELGGYELDSSQPRALATMAHARGIRRGDTIEVGGEVFDVVGSPQPDGTGWAVIPMARIHA